MRNPKQRFSGRAQHYAKYRPGYPTEILSFLEEACGLTGRWVVADVGSGTGILSELFLRNGNRVFGVEPNEEMRGAAERLLGDDARFTSVAGSAEATTLKDGSVDLVTAGQAFHWFDPQAARADSVRVLKPGGHVTLAWNARMRSGTPFLEAYERLLTEHRTDDGGEAGVCDKVDSFFGAEGYRAARFPNPQPLDFEGLKGLVHSSSHLPAQGEPGSKAMLRDLEEIFRANESGGEVTLEYVTLVYCGRLR